MAEVKSKRVELEEVHRLYRANSAEWEFFRQAYLGGREWEEASLLYKYLNESAPQLRERLKQTPLENHCKSVVHTYSGFMWRNPPKRSLGKIESNPAVLALYEDADKEGASLNEFMKSATLWASVFGCSWIVMDKPASKAVTKADELEGDIRPYLKLYFPVHVLNWKFEETDAGNYELTYLKVRERINDGAADGWVYRIWTRQRVEVWRVEGKSEPVPVRDEVNALGAVPAVVHYNTKPLERGVAVSDLQDVARMQRSMYNDLSELAQMIRGSNHKTLVKNKGDDASTGAGGVIIMHEDTMPEKRPYLLQADAEALLGLLDAMEKKVEMINRMAHLTPVRTFRKIIVSAVAIETEFQILNTLLGEKAAQLEVTENQLFRIFCRWENVDWHTAEIVVTYPKRFELRDRKADLDFLEKALKVAEGINSPTLKRELERQVARVVLERDDVLEAVEAELMGTDDAGAGSGENGAGSSGV
jgi:hypothetical protein